MKSATSLSGSARKALDDVQGLSFGLLSTALGFVCLQAAGLMTGQTAGLAIIVAHLTGWSFGLCFFVVNLPFYLIGHRLTGPGFILRTFVCVTILSVLVAFLPGLFTFKALNPLAAAIAFGVLVGLGLLGIIRHGGSLGGIGIAALVIQARWKIPAGYVQLASDILIFCCGLFLFPLDLMLNSFIGAVILNAVIAWNHRPGRYIG
ncbi:MAG: membrane protein [Acidobacteria bacterium]|nr:membrane protein [Acidobacteriota bacterium]